MLAITYWPITLTIFGLLILKWKWGWIKEKQKQNRIRKEQEKLRKEAERIRKEQEEAWLKSEQERKEREAIKEKQGACPRCMPSEKRSVYSCIHHNTKKTKFCPKKGSSCSVI